MILVGHRYRYMYCRPILTQTIRRPLIMTARKTPGSSHPDGVPCVSAKAGKCVLEHFLWEAKTGEGVHLLPTPDPRLTHLLYDCVTRTLSFYRRRLLTDLRYLCNCNPAKQVCWKQGINGPQYMKRWIKLYCLVLLFIGHNAETLYKPHLRLQYKRKDIIQVPCHLDLP